MRAREEEGRKAKGKRNEEETSGGGRRDYAVNAYSLCVRGVVHDGQRWRDVQPGHKEEWRHKSIET